jgi:hypothetical protein
MKVHWLLGTFAFASFVWIGAIGTARADDWFVMGQKELSSASAGTEITAESDKWLKEDIKKTKLSVEGADVEITKVVLHWNNRPDDALTNVGVLKAGGETAGHDAPGREATLMSVTVQYKILNSAPKATIKVWGYD